MGEVRNSSTDDLITKYTFIADGQKVWEWKHKGAGNDNTPNSYAFTYDPLSRLTDSQLFQYSNDQWQRSGSFEEWLGAGDVDAYDKNGNILSLMRSSATGSIMDGFRYEYNGNQLTKLYLDWEDDSDFVTYGYDANGNCTVDGLNALKLEYNYLNLTGAVRDISDNPLATYSWLADGTKVGVKDANGRGFEYLGSLIYTRDGNDLDLESASFGGGRFKVSETDNGRTYTPSYFLTDHLGSTRAIVDSEGVIADRSNYFPFGLRWDDAGSQISDNRWLYNGKEMQTAGLPDGASYLDYGARMYIPRIGRLIGVDKLAEKFTSITPYAYTGNSPVKYIEVGGNFRLDAALIKKYPRLANYLQHGIQEVQNNPRIMAALMKYGQLNESQIREHLIWGKGPEVKLKNIYSSGQYLPGSGCLDVKEGWVKLLESATGIDREVLLFIVGAIILHEYVHYGDDQDDEHNPNEAGNLFEIAAYGQQLGDYNNAKKMWLSWYERQEQNRQNERKRQATASFLEDANSGGLEEGTYVWDGYNWVKQ